ncbi:HEPN domain-containing protein [Roseovarius atlanticus]|nr:HEPN domain-containing protein [Roseovarius atlanticus]
MSNLKETIAEDIFFIFDEVFRFKKMGRDAFAGLDQLEAFCDLPHPSGHGRMLCGLAAYEKVTFIARLAGERNALSGNVTIETLRKLTEELLVQRFLVERRPIDEKQVDRLLSSVGRASKKKCQDKTHFIPCHLMATKSPDAFSVGPVTFRNRSNFKSTVASHIRGYAKNEEPKRREHMRQLMLDALRHYRNFDWVGEIIIEGCDSATSADLAERTVRSAVNLLHLVFRAKNTDRMRVGGAALRVDRRGGLTINSSGELAPHGSLAWAGQGCFPEDWSEWLRDKHLQNILRLFGIALETEANPKLKRPISRRILDAAQWFGDASRDEQPSNRIIKFVTALERMVMTDEKQDATRLVSDRVSALCCSLEANDRAKWKQEVKDVYDLRSRLLHGSMSPFDRSVNSMMGKAANLGEESIIQALLLLGEEALVAEKVPTRMLAKWYDNFVDHVDTHSAANSPHSQGLDET